MEESDKFTAELFESIIEQGKDTIFYKSQQIGEEELGKAQKLAILGQLFRHKPHIFLERYHRFIEPGFFKLKKMKIGFLIHKMANKQKTLPFS